MSLLYVGKIISAERFKIDLRKSICFVFPCIVEAVLSNESSLGKASMSQEDR